MPRLTIRTPEIEEEILTRLSAGEPLAQICRDEGMPHPTTWRDWCAADENLAITYARAREDGFDVIAADILEIADAEPVVYATEHGERVDPGFVQHQKNRIEARLKLLAKWDPKRFGDKLQHTGADGEGPLRIVMQPLDDKL